MRFIPAIDLKDGKCIRVKQGNLKKQTVYNDSPLDQAKEFESYGCKLIHVVDLDGATSGEQANYRYIEKICKNTNLKLQVGGGIRQLSKIKTLLDLGARRVIMGTAAINNKDLLKTAVNKYNDKIAVALDVSKSRVLINGWLKETNIGVTGLINYYNEISIKTIIYTDVSRDGMKGGVNIEYANYLTSISNSKIIISGGVSSIEDIKKIKKNNNKNIVGVISGKAVYDREIDIKEAIKICSR